MHAFSSPRVKPSMADSKASKADGACAGSKEKDPFVRPTTTDSWRWMDKNDYVDWHHRRHVPVNVEDTIRHWTRHCMAPDADIGLTEEGNLALRILYAEMPVHDDQPAAGISMEGAVGAFPLHGPLHDARKAEERTSYKRLTLSKRAWNDTMPVRSSPEIAASLLKTFNSAGPTPKTKETRKPVRQSPAGLHVHGITGAPGQPVGHGAPSHEVHDSCTHHHHASFHPAQGGHSRAATSHYVKPHSGPPTSNAERHFAAIRALAAERAAALVAHSSDKRHCKPRTDGDAHSPMHGDDACQPRTAETYLPQSWQKMTAKPPTTPPPPHLLPPYRQPDVAGPLWTPDRGSPSTSPTRDRWVFRSVSPDEKHQEESVRPSFGQLPKSGKAPLPRPTQAVVHLRRYPKMVRGPVRPIVPPRAAIKRRAGVSPMRISLAATTASPCMNEPALNAATRELVREFRSMSHSAVTAPAAAPLPHSDDPGDYAIALGLGCKLQELDKDAILATAYDNYGGPQGGFCKFLARAMARPGGFATLDEIVRAPAVSPSADAETNRQARSLAFLQSIGAPIAAAALHANGMAISTCPCTPDETAPAVSGLRTTAAARSPSPSGSSGSSGSSTASHTLTRQRADAATTPSAPRPALWDMPQALNSAGVDAEAALNAAGSTTF